MSKNKKILVFAAHPDDEILGCGGTLLSFKKKGFKIKVIFLSDGETSRINYASKKNLIKKRYEQAKNVSKNANFSNQFLKIIQIINWIPFLSYLSFNQLKKR